MGLYVRSYLTWHALGRRLALLGAVMMRPHSRGHIRITSPSLSAMPDVAFNFFDDPRDLPRFLAAVRRAISLQAEPEVARVCGALFCFVNAARLAT